MSKYSENFALSDRQYVAPRRDPSFLALYEGVVAIANKGLRGTERL